MTRSYRKAIPDSYWVVPRSFMAGEYPGSQDDEEARRKLRWLLDHQVTFFLDLTQAGESGLRPYAPLLFEEAEPLRLEVVHRRLPIPDMHTPSPEAMRSILDTLESAFQLGRTVYLHCYGGIGRTGLVVGCYLVRRGMPGRTAINQIASWRQSTPEGWKRSPETDEQIQMVLSWEGLDKPAA